METPKGLLADIASVPLCGEAEANAGTCPESSKIGSLIAAAGAGSEPLYLPQPGRREASWRESGGSGSGWWRREGVSWGALVERGAMGGGEVRRAVVG